MKTAVLVVVLVIIALVIYYYLGAGRGGEKAAVKTAPREVKERGGVIDDLTGKTSVDQFLRARKQIEEVNRTRRRQFEKYGLGK